MRTIPILKTTMKNIVAKSNVSYFDTDVTDIFSLARDASIHRFSQKFNISQALNDNNLILLNELISLVNGIEVTDDEISKVQTDAIYNVKYLDIPTINLDFIKVNASSDFEPVSIISTSNN